MRIGGVSVGKVKSIELAPPEYRVNGKDVAAAEIEIEPEFAPISDRRAGDPAPEDGASARRTSSSPPGPSRSGRRTAAGRGLARRGGRPARGRRAERRAAAGGRQPRRPATQEATQIDEIFNALDEETRLAFQRWQQSAAVAIRDRELDAQRRARQPRALHHRRHRHARDPRRPGGGAARAGPRRRDQLRGALVARARSSTEAIRGQKNTFEGLAAAGRGAGRDVPDPADVPARDPRDARAPGRRSAPTPTR